MGIENKGECLWGEKKCGRALAGINLTKFIIRKREGVDWKR